MIQIDMQMPTNCLDCPVCNEYLMCAIPVNCRKQSENDVREYGQYRPKWCPLKEVEREKTKAEKQDELKQKRREYAKKHQAEHKEKAYQTTKEWRKNNPEKWKAQQARYREKQRLKRKDSDGK